MELIVLLLTTVSMFLLIDIGKVKFDTAMYTLYGLLLFASVSSLAIAYTMTKEYIMHRRLSGMSRDFFLIFQNKKKNNVVFFSRRFHQ